MRILLGFLFRGVDGLSLFEALFGVNSTFHSCLPAGVDGPGLFLGLLLLRVIFIGL